MDAENQTGVEGWEIKLAQDVARRYAGQTDADDLACELCAFLLKLKRKKPPQAADWRAYLAKSLLRRADKIVRSWSRRQEKLVSLESVMNEEAEDIRLEDLLAVDDPDAFLLGELLAVYEELEPRERRFWDLLIEEGGNTAQVGRRVGMPRKTAGYHVQKLRKLLRGRGFGA